MADNYTYTWESLSEKDAATVKRCFGPNGTQELVRFFILGINKTRPSVNYANNWLDQIFPFPGLVWPGKGFYLGCYHYRAINNHFPLYRAIFGMVTNDQTNKQTTG